MTEQEIDAAVTTIEETLYYLKGLGSSLTFGLQSKEGESVEETFHNLMADIDDVKRYVLDYYAGAQENVDWLTQKEVRDYRKEVSEVLLQKLWRVFLYLPEWRLSPEERAKIEKRAGLEKSKN